MKISFTLWCTLVDLFDIKKGCLTKSDFEIFSISDCTYPFYAALMCKERELNIEIVLDEFNLCKKYVHERFLKVVSKELGKCFNKKIECQFCIYRY